MFKPFTSNEARIKALRALSTTYELPLVYEPRQSSAAALHTCAPAALQLLLSTRVLHHTEYSKLYTVQRFVTRAISQIYVSNVVLLQDSDTAAYKLYRII